MMSDSNLDIFDTISAEPAPKSDDKGCRSIVCLKTCYYTDKNGGLHMRKDLVRMKRLSWDYQILEEDAAQIGANQVWGHITNIDECKDGLYSVELCNQSHDWETGYLDDYDYVLVPFDPAEDKEIS